MTRREQATLRRKFNLPFRCECGGLMDYDYEFERVWSSCLKCTPVVKININALMASSRQHQQDDPSA